MTGKGIVTIVLEDTMEKRKKTRTWNAEDDGWIKRDWYKQKYRKRHLVCTQLVGALFYNYNINNLYGFNYKISIICWYHPTKSFGS